MLVNQSFLIGDMATKLIPELKHMNYDRLKKMSAAYTTLPKNTRRRD